MGSPSPGGVEQFPEEQDRWVAECRDDQLVILLLGLVGGTAAEPVDDVEALGVPAGPGRPSAHDLRGCLMTDVLEAAALEQRWELPSERRVIATRRPPIALSPRAVEGGVQRMAGINRRRGAPVAVLVYQPATRTQALHDPFDRGFLSAGEMGEHKAQADEVERAGFERLE